MPKNSSDLEISIQGTNFYISLLSATGVLWLNVKDLGLPTPWPLIGWFLTALGLFFTLPSLIKRATGFEKMMLPKEGMKK